MHIFTTEEAINRIKQATRSALSVVLKLSDMSFVFSRINVRYFPDHDLSHSQLYGSNYNSCIGRGFWLLIVVLRLQNVMHLVKIISCYTKEFNG